MSNDIENVYTSTRLCIPRTLSVCEQPEKLWNSTFIMLGNEVSQVVFDPDGSHIEVRPSDKRTTSLKCFTGEPELESLMANGNQIIFHDIKQDEIKFSSLCARFYENFAVGRRAVPEEQKPD